MCEGEIDKKMNREIKFRYIIEDGDGIKKIFVALEEAEKGFGISPDKKVIARSEYTGQYDCKKNEICEDDIVCHKVTDGSEVKNIIVFEDGSFKMKPIHEIATLPPKDWYHTEIIGSIYENPELLNK